MTFSLKMKCKTNLLNLFSTFTILNLILLETQKYLLKSYKLKNIECIR